MEKKKLHIVMFPWFAMGHITPFLHLANHLATRGHQTTLLLPNKAKLLLDSSNHHPSLITLRPIPVCHVSPLPHGAETTADIPIHLEPHLATAMDLTRRHVASAIADVTPVDFLFYDFTPWAHDVAAQFGAKSVCYVTDCAACIAIGLVPGFGPNGPAQIPDGYPSNKVVFRGEEIPKNLGFFGLGFGSGLTFYQRSTNSLSACDAICIRTLREVEGIFCDYIIKSYNYKPVLLTGPILSPGSDGNDPDPKWAKWLDRFEPGSVVFCTLGSQVILEKAQFEELVLGFEMTKLPFLAVLKPPSGCASVDEALPEGFKERVGEKGVVYGGWVPQPEILSHKSIGCFVTHCGFGAMWESLLSECQIVAMPQLGDQILIARLMAEEMKVCVEVERDFSNIINNNGWITKESLCNAIKSVMDEFSEIGDLVRKNHAKWRETLVAPGFMSSYIDNFINDLNNLLG